MHQQIRRIDSDEEPPAAVGHGTALVRSTPMPPTAPAMSTVSALSGSESRALEELRGRLQARYDAMTSLPPCVPAVVSFCVGGRPFAVSRALLEKDPSSLLFVLTLQHYAPSRPTPSFDLPSRRQEDACAASSSPTSAAAAITLPEKSPTPFAMLLNLLRGYRNAIPVEWMDCCREEAAYYGLEKSWSERFNVLATPHYFRNPLHSSKMLSEAVLGVASDFLTTGEHHIDYSVVQCDRVGVGVISTSGASLEELGPQSQDGSNGAFYWNDGKLSFYLGEPRMVETGFPFPAGALIRVLFDADARIIRWVVNGEYCVAMERLPAGRHYAFSCIASRSSQVTIVPT